MLTRTVGQGGADVVGEAATLEDACVLATQVAPDVIIVDGRLSDDIRATLHALAGAAPSAALLVIASLEETGVVRTALAAGARGAIARPVIASQVRAALARLLASAD